MPLPPATSPPHTHRWFRMEDIAFSRYVGGFGLVRNVAPKEYLAARPDPVAAFSAPVCGHMNADHESDTIAMVHKYVGIKVGAGLAALLAALGAQQRSVQRPTAVCSGHGDEVPGQRACCHGAVAPPVAVQPRHDDPCEHCHVYAHWQCTLSTADACVPAFAGGLCAHAEPGPAGHEP